MNTFCVYGSYISLMALVIIYIIYNIYTYFQSVEVTSQPRTERSVHQVILTLIPEMLSVFGI